MYVCPIKPNEIYHYGMPERSGRYAWGSGDRPYQRLEGKASKMEKRLNKKFMRIDTKTSKLQTKANKKFNKANEQRNSRFKFRRNKAESSFDKGYELQEKRERLEYKMSNKYDKYLKKFEKLDLVMDEDLKKKGLEYYNRVLDNTNSQYKAAIVSRHLQKRGGS